ncbi:MAG: hypothetical protein Q8O55_07365 [Dehalococcoidales bacterium]|nr:hypothetical protein [Dehalococcoidales bacterium]
MNIFEKVDNALHKGTCNRENALDILKTGIEEGTLADVAKVIADHYGLLPAEVVVWFSQVLKCRAQQSTELLQKIVADGWGAKTGGGNIGR